MKKHIWMVAILIATACYADEIRKLGVEDLYIHTTDNGPAETSVSAGGVTSTHLAGDSFPWTNAYTRTIRPAHIVGNSGGAITGYTIDWGLLDNTPTTLSGYGLADAAPLDSPTFTGPIVTDNEVTAKQYNSSAEANTHYINVANATAPTSPSLGDCYYDNVTFGWLCYNGSSWAASTATSVAWDNVTAKGTLGQVKDLVIRGYSADDNNTLLWKADVEQTLTQLDCITGGTDNVTITLHECSSSGASCLTTGLSVAATSSGTSDSTVPNAVIDADDWVRVLVESIEGTPTHVACTVRYTVAR